MAADGDSETHAWSEGASRGAHAVKLDSLADGQTRLVRCTPLGNGQSGAGSAPALHSNFLPCSTSSSSRTQNSAKAICNALQATAAQHG